MVTREKIAAAAAALPREEQKKLLDWLSALVQESEQPAVQSHSVLEIAPVSLGELLQPFDADEDLLGEMLRTACEPRDRYRFPCRRGGIGARVALGSPREARDASQSWRPHTAGDEKRRRRRNRLTRFRSDPGRAQRIRTVIVHSWRERRLTATDTVVLRGCRGTAVEQPPPDQYCRQSGKQTRDSETHTRFSESRPGAEQGRGAERYGSNCWIVGGGDPMRAWRFFPCAGQFPWDERGMGSPGTADLFDDLALAGQAAVWCLNSWRAGQWLLPLATWLPTRPLTR